MEAVCNKKPLQLKSETWRIVKLNHRKGEVTGSASLQLAMVIQLTAGSQRRVANDGLVMKPRTGTQTFHVNQQ